MNDEQFKKYVTTTEAMVAQMNENLEKFQQGLKHIAEIEKANLQLAAGAYDMSYLAVRVLSELHVDFRTMLIRFAQEPAANPAAQQNRQLLLDTLAETQRAAGERPSLKPVPPSGSGP